jgi:hypothetical protein
MAELLFKEKEILKPVSKFDGQFIAVKLAKANEAGPEARRVRFYEHIPGGFLVKTNLSGTAENAKFGLKANGDAGKIERQQSEVKETAEKILNFINTWIAEGKDLKEAATLTWPERFASLTGITSKVLYSKGVNYLLNNKLIKIIRNPKKRGEILTLPEDNEI